MQCKTSRVSLQVCRQLILFSLLWGMRVREGESSSAREIGDLQCVTHRTRKGGSDARKRFNALHVLPTVCLWCNILFKFSQKKKPQILMNANKHTSVCRPYSPGWKNTPPICRWGLFVEFPTPGRSLPVMADRGKGICYTCLKLIHHQPEIMKRWHIQTDKRQVRQFTQLFAESFLKEGSTSPPVVASFKSGFVQRASTPFIEKIFSYSVKFLNSGSSALW